VPQQKGICRILCLGDVVGGPGRRALGERLPELRAGLAVDMVIANGENASGGIGLTPGNFRELLAAGVDVVTSGNHIWKYKEMYPSLDTCAAVLRPANFSPAAPGRGCCLHELPCGTRVGVLNLIGRIFMEPADCPFQAADVALRMLAEQGAHFCCVDFHAEASSEKRAMAHYLDGRAAAVLGTHTHVQTSDSRVSALGTASLTDLGMCGVEADAVLGMNKEAAIKRFITGLPQAFRPAKGQATLNGALLDIDAASGKALSIRLLRGDRIDCAS
jgi:metallophosphoesterase (TIGR00282 family)